MTLIGRFKDVLVLAPHTDDGELGAGGTIHRLIGEGARVHYVAFSTARESLRAGLPLDTLAREVVKATARLGVKRDDLTILDYPVRKLSSMRQEILEELVKIKRIADWDLVLMPSLNDLHQDHHTVAMEGIRAFKQTTCLAYEVPWNNLTFSTTSFVRLTAADVEAKSAAIACYESQSHRKYADPQLITALAMLRGVQIGFQYAEAFEVLRWVMT